MTKIWKHLLTQAYVQVKKDACQPNKNQTQLVKSSRKRPPLFLWLNKQKKSCIYQVVGLKCDFIVRQN